MEWQEIPIIIFSISWSKIFSHINIPQISSLFFPLPSTIHTSLPPHQKLSDTNAQPQYDHRNDDFYHSPLIFKGKSAVTCPFSHCGRFLFLRILVDSPEASCETYHNPSDLQDRNYFNPDGNCHFMNRCYSCSTLWNWLSFSFGWTSWKVGLFLGVLLEVGSVSRGMREVYFILYDVDI